MNISLHEKFLVSEKKADQLHISLLSVHGDAGDRYTIYILLGMSSKTPMAPWRLAKDNHPV